VEEVLGLGVRQAFQSGDVLEQTEHHIGKSLFG
jgi:hypothetical protein